MEYFFCRTNLLLETFKAKLLTMRSKFEQTMFDQNFRTFNETAKVFQLFYETFF